MSRIDAIGPDVELIKDRVMVTLEWIGEGWSGDYQEDDPDDDPLLRFTVYEQYESGRGWDQVDDASYCTSLIADQLTPADKNLVLEYLMSQVYDQVRDGKSIKRLCENLSWIDRDTVEYLRLEKERSHAAD
jgi:hypothetical protein